MGSEIFNQISYLLTPYLGYAREGVSVQNSDGVDSIGAAT